MTINTLWVDCCARSKMNNKRVRIRMHTKSKLICLFYFDCLWPENDSLPCKWKPVLAHFFGRKQTKYGTVLRLKMNTFLKCYATTMTHNDKFLSNLRITERLFNHKLIQRELIYNIRIIWHKHIYLISLIKSFAHKLNYKKKKNFTYFCFQLYCSCTM